MAGQPKPGFFIAVLLIVGAFIAFAFYRCNAKKGDDTANNGKGSGKPIDIKDIRGSDMPPAEGSDSAGLTTVKDYSFDPSTRLPEIKGAGDYVKLGTPRVVKFAVNVWAGWAPIVWANQGSAPKKIWKDAKGNDFQVELVLVDDPIAMGDTVASGQVHIGWATVDMLPLVIERLHRDPRGMPRVFQQIDWSNGGDGIVVRDAIKNIGDLKGKSVALSKYSPSHYFLLNMLLEGGMQPTDVDMKFTKTAFEAAAAFNADKSFAAAVSWSPDIYNLTKQGTGNRMLVSTQTANKLIADVWFARADFAKENPDIIEGLVRGILDATTDLSDAKAKSTDKTPDPRMVQVGDLMDAFYKLDKGTGLAMLGDAHWTNYAENKDFLLNQNNPTNFERTYGTAYRLYRAIPGSPITVNVAFDQIMDFSVIKKLGDDPKYANQKNEYQFNFTPTATDSINVEDAVLTKTVTISFPPNKWDLHQTTKDPSGKDVLYDANVDRTIEDIAKLAGEFGMARIQISGHTDGSMRGKVDEDLVRTLSQRRADAVKQELVNRFKMDPKQFVTVGYGWSKPADPKDPDNNAKNRRVEIKVVPAEGG